MGGWTQTPNFIYDLMPKMKEAELKVVMAVVRQTTGWQTERVKLRLADFEQLTGMTRPSVNTGIKQAVERGVLSREVDGESFIYWISEPCATNDTVKNFNHEDGAQEQELPLESKESLPSAVKNSNQDAVKNLNSNKRNINTNKQTTKAEEIAADAAPLPPVVDSKPKPVRSRKRRDPPSSEAPPQQEREPGEWQEFVGAFCWLCHGHKEVKTLTKEQRGALLSEARIVHEEYTVKDLREWYKRIWAKSWQYLKNNTARPYPADVRSSIAQLRAKTPEGFEEVPVLNGYHVNGTSKVARNMAAMDDYEELKARLGVTT